MDKKILRIFLSLIISVSLTGCGLIRGVKNQIDNFAENNEPSRIYEMSSEIMRCIDEKDKEGMKQLFCEKIRESEDFDQQIDSIFEFIDSGSTWSYNIKTTASGGKSWNHGDVTHWDVSPEIRDIESAYDHGNYFTSKYYRIHYYWHIVYEKDRSLEGIQYMDIELLNIETLTIGEYLG